MREKIIKKIKYKATMTTVVNVQICTLLETLMWSIFEAKCVKVVSFSIIHYFASIDVDALIKRKVT